MLEYKASTIARVPVALTITATGLPHTGVLAAAVTVTVVKSNGVIVTYTPGGGQWTEFTWDAYSGSGYYNLSIPVGTTDVVGILNYCVSVAGDDLYFGVVNIVANLESDTYASVGAVSTSVTEMMGLLHKNAVLEGQVYNAGGRLTNATLYVYDNNINAGVNDHITGLIHSYGIFATYDVNDHQTYYSLQSLS
jgi:hypothetical protein